MKLPNASLHHYNEYPCDHWKYEHFFETKESWKSEINSVVIKAGQDNQWKKKKIHTKKNLHTKNTDKYM